MRLAKNTEAEVREKMDKIIQEESEPTENETNAHTSAEQGEVTFYEEDNSQL